MSERNITIDILANAREMIGKKNALIIWATYYVKLCAAILLDKFILGLVAEHISNLYLQAIALFIVVIGTGLFYITSSFHAVTSINMSMYYKTTKDLKSQDKEYLSPIIRVGGSFYLKMIALLALFLSGTHILTESFVQAILLPDQSSEYSIVQFISKFVFITSMAWQLMLIGGSVSFALTKDREKLKPIDFMGSWLMFSQASKQWYSGRIKSSLWIGLFGAALGFQFHQTGFFLDLFAISIAAILSVSWGTLLSGLHFLKE